eukprot:snap_masked-scaffold_17-processed-gene-2.21-mRNA-1 protein AED:1.00 eAED:1.00 QI:0/-1/0/0/-1/1/1/0/59
MKQYFRRNMPRVLLSLIVIQFFSVKKLILNQNKKVIANLLEDVNNDPALLRYLEDKAKI